jgi:hypothetical protein
MASKQILPIKDMLAAIDMGATSVWDELSDDEKKQVSFWLLNRWASSIKGTREAQELAIFKVNEYYNKNWNSLSTKHPKLQWQLLCQSGNTGKIEFHEWIGFQKKDSGTSKAIRLIQEVYPHLKNDEAELLARISTKKELKQLAEDHDIDVKL